MLVPVQWLREYTHFELGIQALADRLTMAGLEVEEIIEQDGEAIFSTYVTPNRPDLLSMVGVAREVSALLGIPLNRPEPSFREGEADTSSLAKVETRSPANCPRYSARIITGVQITHSPEWLQEKLIAADVRPINSVVDATNYVLLELGQPLHAFDYDLLADHHIIVRQAEAGERIVTIDGEERTLDPDVLVIADAAHAVAIAGIMGGRDTEVNPSTRNVLLESAHFNRLSIRRSARKLAMATESSYRFERGVDPELTVYALDRVAALIQESSGGTIARGAIDVYPETIRSVALTIRPERASMLLGTRVSGDEVADYLERLGMTVRRNGGIKVTVPTFRPDIQREVDLIEEVGRLHGYERIPETLPAGETLPGRDSDEGLFESQVSSLLVAAGIEEVVTNTLVPPIEGEDQAAIRNPLSDDLSRLRNRLIPNLLGVVSYNIGRGARDVGVFESGRVFEPCDDKTITERISLAGALTGNMWAKAWNVDKRSLQVDFFLCKGIVENLLDRFGIEDVLFSAAEIPGFHPTRAVTITAGGSELGVIGEISAKRAARYDLATRTYAFELNLDELMSKARGVRQYRPFSRYPALSRDLAVVVAEDMPYRSVHELIVKGAGELLESVSLFDLYRGPPLSAGQKSLAFTIVLRSLQRTLRDEEIDERLKRVKALLAKELAASFRET